MGRENEDVAASLNDLATVFRHQHKLAEAETLTREALAIRQKLFGNDSLEVAATLHNLSIVLGDEGKLAESEAIAREMLAIRRKLLGPQDPLVAVALNDVAWTATASGKLNEAESVQEEALAMQRRILGDGHPEVARSLSTLGQIMAKQGDLTESHAVLKATLSIQRKLLGEDNPETLYTLRSFGWTLEAEGKWSEAESVHREALVFWCKRAGNEDPQALAELAGLVRTLVAQQKFDEAEQFLGEVLTPAFVKQPASLDLLVQRIDLRGRQGRWSEAAADATAGVSHQPAEYYRYYILAPLLVMAHDRPAYEQLCPKMLALFTNTMNPYVAERVAQSCLLLPDSGADLRAVDQLADKAVMRGSGEAYLPFFQVCKAMSNYRLGRFPEAVEWAEKSLKSSQIDAQAKAYAVLAMAHWQLDQKDEARAMLAKGDLLAPNLSAARNTGDIGNGWLAWIIARVSLDEATALIQSRTESDIKTDKP